MTPVHVPIVGRPSFFLPNLRGRFCLNLSTPCCDLRKGIHSLSPVVAAIPHRTEPNKSTTNREMATDNGEQQVRGVKPEAFEMISSASGEHAREEGYNEEVAMYKSTFEDARAMKRMGRSQELIRHYRVFSMVSFVGMATAAWELTLYQVSPALREGGLPALIYSNIWVFCAFVPVVLSLAEMSSMAPIAGAQYHWVSEFAPEKYQKFMSYLTG